MKRNLLSLLALCFCYLTFSQTQNVGPILSYKKVVGGVIGKTSRGYFDIRAYSDQVIRVRISEKDDFSSHSYILQENTIPNFDAKVLEENKIIYIKTPSLSVEIEKSPALRICFKDSAGIIINEDEEGEGLGTTFAGGKVTSYKKLHKNERFVGLGEALGNLDRSGTVVTLQNADHFNYGDPRLSMYTSIPFFIGLHDSTMYGILYHNTYNSTFNFGAGNIRFSSIAHEGGDADYFFIYGKSMAKIVEHYTNLTGRSPLPPIWSLGYHQSRNSYYPQDRVLWIAKTFREKKIPLDCIVLDADYLHEYQPFRLNYERFPDMKGLTSKLKQWGIEVTASVNPGICNDSSYTPMYDALKKDVILHYADGTPYIAPIAPNINYYIDYTLPEGRDWWIDQMKMLEDNGIKGYWNDMNEPAVSESAMPDNVVFNYDGKQSSSMEAHNLFGMMMARSSYEAGLKNGNGIRPFVMTRSGFAGVQRYAAVWTGDNTANNNHLLGGVLLNNTMGLSGVPFVGPDLGGFIGDGNQKLFMRWVEVGIFSPFLRNHRIFYANSSEPWSYGEEAEGVAKSYIEFRYRLMPYIYDKFFEATQTGMPLSRALCIDYPYDDLVYSKNYQYEFMFGDAFFITPYDSNEQYKKIYFPEGTWYDFFSDNKIVGKQEIVMEYPIFKIPIFVKAGSIIPIQSQIQTTKELSSDTLYLHIYKGDSITIYTHYEDDGSTYDYEKQGYCKRIFTYNGIEKTLTIGEQEGNFNSHYKKVALVLHGFSESTFIKINNDNVTLNTQQELVFDPLSSLEDFYYPDMLSSAKKYVQAGKQKVAVIDYNKDEINIKL